LKRDLHFAKHGHEVGAVDAFRSAAWVVAFTSESLLKLVRAGDSMILAIQPEMGYCLVPKRK